MNIELSIIIPIYNVEKYIERCLQSIERQSDSKVEVICVDDGSTDSSISICQKYKSKISNLKIIQQKNSGVSVARNKGIETALGAWVWFVDPDDWIEDSAIDELRKIEKDGCDVLVFSYYNVYKDDSVQNSFDFREKVFQVGGDCEETRRLKESLINPERVYIKGYFGAVWNSLFRREYLLEHHCWFDKLLRKSQDTLFNLEVLNFNPMIKFVNIALYYYVHNSASICHKYMPDAEDKLIPILEALNQYIALQKNDFSDAFLERRRTTLFQILHLGIIHRDNKESWFGKRKHWKAIKNSHWFENCLNVSRNEKMSVKKRIKLFWAKMNCLMLLAAYNNYKQNKIV